MEFLFLGTSAGTPTRTRNVTGLALRPKNQRTWLLVDCGEGTQHQVLKTSLSLSTLSTICITHVHGDHCYGLPGVLASAGMGKRQAPLTVIAPKAIQQWFEMTRQLTDLYLSYPIEFVAVEDLLEPWITEHFVIRAYPLSHRVPCYAYQFTERAASTRRLDVAKLTEQQIPPAPYWRQLQQGDNPQLPDGRQLLADDYCLAPAATRQVVVAGDNDTPALLQAACAHAQLLIHEATYTAEISAKVGEFPQHSDAARVAKFAQAVELPNLILTHFSSRYAPEGHPSPSLDDLAAEARRDYHGQLFLARDFDQFELDTAGSVTRSARLPTTLSSPQQFD